MLTCRYWDTIWSWPNEHERQQETRACEIAAYDAELRGAGVDPAMLGAVLASASPSRAKPLRYLGGAREGSALSRELLQPELEAV